MGCGAVGFEVMGWGVEGFGVMQYGLGCAVLMGGVIQWTVV